MTTQQNRMEPHETEQKEKERNKTEQNKTEENKMERKRTEPMKDNGTPRLVHPTLWSIPFSFLHPKAKFWASNCANAKNEKLQGKDGKICT